MPAWADANQRGDTDFYGRQCRKLRLGTTIAFSQLSGLSPRFSTGGFLC
jgi:hypothetical protein